MSPNLVIKKAARKSIRRPLKQTTEQDPKAAPPQPVVVRSFDVQSRGIRSFATSRYVLGYLLSGHKFLYNGDLRCEVRPGDVYFMSEGTHYMEDRNDGAKPFEQIQFFYTSAQMGRVIAELGINYNVNTCVHHSCEECMIKDYVVSHGWTALKTFFGAVDKNLRDGFYDNNPTAEALALTSLVHQIITRPEGCLRTRVLGSTDPEKELMERQLHEYVFSNMTLDQFAKRSNRSLSSFKKKFKAYYNESPHHWVIRQRLMHARMQVISTDRDVAQISSSCNFPNVSYFIRLFSKEFGATPAQYRARCSNVAKAPVEKQAVSKA